MLHAAVFRAPCLQVWGVFALRGLAAARVPKPEPCAALDARLRFDGCAALIAVAGGVAASYREEIGISPAMVGLLITWAGARKSKRVASTPRLRRGWFESYGRSEL